MSRAVDKLLVRVSDLEWQLSEANRIMAMHKQSAQRVCNDMRANQGKENGDAMSVGSAWAALSYIAGDNGPAPWSKPLEVKS